MRLHVHVIMLVNDFWSNAHQNEKRGGRRTSRAPNPWCCGRQTSVPCSCGRGRRRRPWMPPQPTPLPFTDGLPCLEIVRAEGRTYNCRHTARIGEETVEVGRRSHAEAPRGGPRDRRKADDAAGRSDPGREAHCEPDLPKPQQIGRAHV